jgi:hypothetical protein
MSEDAVVHEVRHRPRKRHAVPAVQIEVPVPALDAFGHQAFTAEALQSLTQSLQDPRWPRGTLNIFGLEGLLTALLVLPFGLRPGSWLPLIWNGSGWRTPPLLHDQERFSSFVELLMSFMRSIDQALITSPPRFTSVLDGVDDAQQPAAECARQAWARGFGLALQVCVHIRVPSGSQVHRALCSIAAHSHTPAAGRAGYMSPPSIQQMVLLLAATRTSRGPLGPLIKVKRPQHTLPLREDHKRPDN